MPHEPITEYQLGQELDKGDGRRWLVCRIVECDSSLVVNERGQEFICKETYVMLKSDKGEIDFVVLLSKDDPYVTDPTRRIPSLPSLWRKHDKPSNT